MCSCQHRQRLDLTYETKSIRRRLNMSNNPGATSKLPEELGKPLEASLKHLVDNSGPYQTESDKDDLAGMCDVTSGPSLGAL